MQRLGNLNNKLVVESIYEPDNKNVIWKDVTNNEFKEYNGSSWVKSDNIGTPKEEFLYKFVKLPDMDVTVTDGKTSSVTKIGFNELIKDAICGIITKDNTICQSDSTNTNPNGVNFTLQNIYGPNYVRITLVTKDYLSSEVEYKVGDIVLDITRAYQDLTAKTYKLQNIVLFKY